MGIECENGGYKYKAFFNGEWHDLTLSDSPNELTEWLKSNEEWARVKHGHWDNKQIGEDISPYGAPYTIARCSVCRGKVFVFAEDYLVNYPYCPLCGAKMDEVTDGT